MQRNFRIWAKPAQPVCHKKLHHQPQTCDNGQALQNLYTWLPDVLIGKKGKTKGIPPHPAGPVGAVQPQVSDRHVAAEALREAQHLKKMHEGPTGKRKEKITGGKEKENGEKKREKKEKRGGGEEKRGKKRWARDLKRSPFPKKSCFCLETAESSSLR